MTKPDEIFLIFQLILVNCVLWTLETLLFYMFKTLSGEKSNNLYQRDNTSTTFSHLKKHITHWRTAQQMQSVQLCSRWNSWFESTHYGIPWWKTSMMDFIIGHMLRLYAKVTQKNQSFIFILAPHIGRAVGAHGKTAQKWSKKYQIYKLAENPSKSGKRLNQRKFHHFCQKCPSLRAKLGYQSLAFGLGLAA